MKARLIGNCLGAGEAQDLLRAWADAIESSGGGAGDREAPGPAGPGVDTLPGEALDAPSRPDPEEWRAPVSWDEANQAWLKGACDVDGVEGWHRPIVLPSLAAATNGWPLSRYRVPGGWSAAPAPESSPDGEAEADRRLPGDRETPGPAGPGVDTLPGEALDTPSPVTDVAIVDGEPVEQWRWDALVAEMANLYDDLARRTVTPPEGHEVVVLPVETVDRIARWGVAPATTRGLIAACRAAVDRRPEPKPAVERVPWWEAKGRSIRGAAIEVIEVVEVGMDDEGPWVRVEVDGTELRSLVDPDGMVEVLALDGER